MSMMKKAIVGMSGGVDSAVCAYLMKMAGYDVIGLTLKTWIAEDGTQSRCCELDDAQRICDVLGIPYYVHSCMDEFDKSVIKPFIDCYLHGKTPNPCIGCNKDIKWEKMMEAARMYGADVVATGHYASVVELSNGRYTVKAGEYADKDQSYMLYRLTQEQLRSTVMPLGKLSKDEVRQIAKKAGLPVADKPDSQEICFIPDGDYASYIEEHADEIPGEGNFVDEEGKILGKHKGIIHYTVGQRKGLGIALGYPAFVNRICPDTGDIVLGKEDSIYRSQIDVEDISFVGLEDIEEGEEVSCHVKVRYHHAGEKAVVKRIGVDSVHIVFENPVRFAAPGQSAVFYDDDGCVLGGGIISFF